MNYEQRPMLPAEHFTTEVEGTPTTRSPQRPVTPERPKTDRRSLRLAAALLVLGEVLYVVVGLFHPDRQPPNNHRAAFTEYAHSHDWIAVHAGQYGALAVIIAGLIVLFFALDVRSGALGWLAHLAAISAGVALALHGVLQAVDGVALKHAADAWVNAPSPEKAVRFANAETVRWLEWGVRSYAQFTLGLSVLLFGTVIAGSRRLPGFIGYLAAVSGLALIAQGVVLGSDGFSSTGTTLGLTALAAELIWVFALGVTAWRMNSPVADDRRPVLHRPSMTKEHA